MFDNCNATTVFVIPCVVWVVFYAKNLPVRSQKRLDAVVHFNVRMLLVVPAANERIQHALERSRHETIAAILNRLRQKSLPRYHVGGHEPSRTNVSSNTCHVVLTHVCL